MASNGTQPPSTQQDTAPETGRTARQIYALSAVEQVSLMSFLRMLDTHSIAEPIGHKSFTSLSSVFNISSDAASNRHA